jgi:N-acetylglucosamine-6-sulfatase
LAASARQPNIVLILTDDLDAAAAEQMPLLKTLITDQGANFRRHYVSLSLCCPSRTTTLRGQFAHNTGIFSNTLPDGGFELVHAYGLEDSTVATWLQGAGYRTALFGKYLNGYPDTAPSETYIPPGWKEWMSPIDGDPHGGFDYTMNHNGKIEYHGSRSKDYLTDVISTAAAEFIQRSSRDFPSHPFFVYVAPYTPHKPATPAPRHRREFKGVEAPRPPSFNEADVSDKPAWLRALAPLKNAQIKEIDSFYRARRQSLLSVDDMIGNIVSTLEAEGQLSNTYVMFASDNGYHLGQHRLDAGKNSGFEEDILVPLRVRGPGIAAGLLIDSITANVDYAPTFADIAGLAAPSFVDGRSWLPLWSAARGQAAPTWRQALLLEHKRGTNNRLLEEHGTREPQDPFDKQVGADISVPAFSGLRVADGTTYLEYETGEFELYDNVADPFQLQNVFAVTPDAVKQRLTNWVAALKDAQGAALRLAEESPPQRSVSGR